MRFLGSALCDTVPDEKTIWELRDRLVQADIIGTLFYRFTKQLEEKKIITYRGSILDAVFADALRQRNRWEENKEMKEGKAPAGWEQEENRNKRWQKDADARRAKKNNEVNYGYKDHIKADKKTKMITRYTVMDAAVHGSQELKNLVEGKDKRIYAGGAYTGEEVQGCILDFTPFGRHH